MKKEPSATQQNKLISLFNQGLFKQLLPEVTALLKEFPSSSMLHNLQGAAHAGLEDHKTAVQCYSSALKIDSENQEAYFNLGNSLMVKKQFEVAIKCYQKLIKLNPKFYGAYINAGFCFYQDGPEEHRLNMSVLENKPKVTRG